MPFTKDALAILTLAVAVLCTVWHITSAQETANPKEPDGGAARARLEAAKKVYELKLETTLESPAVLPFDVELFYPWSVRWAHAERDIGRTKEERITAFEGHRNRMKFFKDILVARRKQGAGGSTLEIAPAEFFLLEADEWLAAAKSKDK